MFVKSSLKRCTPSRSRQTLLRPCRLRCAASKARPRLCANTLGSIYVYVCIYIHKCVCMYTHTHTHTHTHYTHTHTTHTHTLHTYTHTHTHTLCIYIMYIYTYTCYIPRLYADTLGSKEEIGVYAREGYL